MSNKTIKLRSVWRDYKDDYDDDDENNEVRG